MRLFCLFLLSITIFSCSKARISQIDNEAPSNFSQLFEDFWGAMNTNYVYWDLDTTNWDNVYYKFKPLFNDLDINDTSDLLKSVDYFRQMTNGIFDAHFSIVFKKSILKTISVYPFAERRQGNPNFHFPFDFSEIDKKYFDQDYMIGYDSLNTLYGQPLQVTFAFIKKDILYFRCNEFLLFNSYNSANNSEVKTILGRFFDTLNNIPLNIKGIIIDLRNNQGGNVGDLDFFMGHFINAPLQIGFSKYKSGSNRLDYTPWIKAFAHPYSSVTKSITVPVIALVDNYTVSMAEAVTMSIHALSSGKVLGEKTWGATGPLASNLVYNAGSFSIKDFLTVNTSSAAFKYIDGKIYEGTGFPPDIEVPFNLISAQKGIDEQLEKAISLIN